VDVYMRFYVDSSAQIKKLCQLWYSSVGFILII
ncbi:unnamed protein product, partial [Rotaria magnacalcarata]